MVVICDEYYFNFKEVGQTKWSRREINVGFTHAKQS